MSFLVINSWKTFERLVTWLRGEFGSGFFM